MIIGAVAAAGDTSAGCTASSMASVKIGLMWTASGGNRARVELALPVERLRELAFDLLAPFIADGQSGKRTSSIALRRAPDPQRSFELSACRVWDDRARRVRAAIVEYIDEHNVEPKPFRWTKSANDILDSLARFGTRTLAAHAP